MSHPVSPIPLHGPQGPLRRPSGQGVSDEDLIATWQLFRQTMGSVDGQLAAALIEGDHQPSIFYEALVALAGSPDRMMPMGDLAATIGISTGSLTKLIDRMVQAGLVRRHHSTSDRRVVYAILTAKGAAHERRSTPAYAQQLRGDFDKLGPNALDAIRAVCRQIQTNFAAAAESADAAQTAQAMRRSASDRPAGRVGGVGRG